MMVGVLLRTADMARSRTRYLGRIELQRMGEASRLLNDGPLPLVGSAGFADSPSASFPSPTAAPTTTCSS